MLTQAVVTCLVMILHCSYGMDSDRARSCRNIGYRNNRFAVDVFTKLRAHASGANNIFFSPFSLSSALSMTLMGARSQTARELSYALHFGRLDNPHRTFRELLWHTSDLNTTFNVANRLYGNRDYLFLRRFEYETLVYYGSRMELLEFRDSENARTHINRYVSDNTDHNIDNLIPPGMLTADTVLVLVNAVYLNAEWQQPFDITRTATKPFYLGRRVKHAPMMAKLGHFKYGTLNRLDAEVIELPYAGNELSMFIFLPSLHSSVDELSETIRYSHLQSLHMAVTDTEMLLEFPKFTVEDDMDVKHVMQQLGVSDLFERRHADLSGIGRESGIYVSDIVHKARINVDEIGTEAAAATGIHISSRIRPLPVETELEVKVNRPFVYLIQERLSRAVVFMGRVVDPVPDAPWEACEQGVRECGEASEEGGEEEQEEEEEEEEYENGIAGGREGVQIRVHAEVNEWMARWMNGERSRDSHS